MSNKPEVRKHYLLFAIKVIAHHENNRIEFDLNALMPSEYKGITLRGMSGVQSQAQSRYFIQNDPEMKSKVADVLIQNVIYLGHMTETEFTDGINIEPEEEKKES